MGFECWGVTRVRVDVVGIGLYSLMVSLSVLLCCRVSCALVPLFVYIFVRLLVILVCACAVFVAVVFWIVRSLAPFVI